ncbi:M48 family metalloprotease [Pseudolabrys sp. FHR47]|uniref:M48 family metalloprotease n=1 Tax=Pseudolabrys sp. FHR47 TaxID=2562284 RepID=UPI0010BF359E|nr:M48 family metalloprotease [Pseudolabrys sp. FHR47]
MRNTVSQSSMRRPRTRRLWLAVPLSLAVLAGCTQAPSTPRQVSLPIPRTIEREAPPTATVRENARILASYGGVYENPRLQADIEQTVAKLVAASERPDLKYQVTMLNSPAINAFALPNGNLYISRGLIALAADKAELASVLAHEMGHVIARHAAIREEQARQNALVSQVVSEVLSDPNMGALALAKSKLTLASFSRAQEFEADGIGVGISSRAGFDSFGAARFLTAMQRNADLKNGRKTENVDPQVVDFMSSHPATPERVKNALANARQVGGPGNGTRDRDAYLAAIDGMVYGEDPSEGFARGRRFLHPKLGFTFVAPDRFSLDNTAQAVLGLKDGGDEALRLDVVSVPAEQRLSDYLKSGWIDNVDPSSAEEFTVNGFQAATAAAKGERWSFRLFAVRFGSDVYRFIFAARSLTAENDRAFRESVSTFRRMSLKESAGVKPLHIRVVTVKPGDTIDKLADRMASDHKLARFLLLNGFSANDKLKPGEKVKLVME